MVARLIDGKGLAARIRAGLKVETDELTRSGFQPGLAVVLVGDDPASHVYVANKTKACAEIGFRAFDHHLPAATTEEFLLELVDTLNKTPSVDGILVQLPLPSHIDSRKVLLAIDPRKDVDGFHPDNLGRMLMGEPRFVPCTPAGVMRLLAEDGVNLEGKHAVVLGRSNIVGKPAAVLLSAANATVTLCHSKTLNLADVVRQADVLVAAIGRPKFVKGDWIKPGAIVIDVGMNRPPEGKLCGDVDTDAASVNAAAITPVPGGVGPMTIALLMENTLVSARRRARGQRD